MSDAVRTFFTGLETIESAYEFMLAYAAQGRDTDEGAKTSPSIRETLEGLLAALPAVRIHRPWVVRTRATCTSGKAPAA